MALPSQRPSESQLPSTPPSHVPSTKPSKRPSDAPSSNPSRSMAPSSAPSPVECGATVLFPTNGDRYFVTSDKVTYDVAKQYVAALPHCCDNRAAHIVTITDAAEQVFVENLLLASGHALGWIGLTDDVQDNVYDTWITGEPVTYTNWYPGDPLPSTAEIGCVAVQFVLSSGQWVSFTCATSLWTLVEYDCA